MKKIKFICSILFLAVVASGCTKIEGIDKDLSFLSTVGFTNPSKVFDISNDNSGNVKITPLGDGAASYTVNFGHGTGAAASAVVAPGLSATHSYPEGTYTVSIAATDNAGVATTNTFPLTVTYRAPENLLVTKTQSVHKITVQAKADYAASFMVYFGDVSNEVGTPMAMGQELAHEYATHGDYNLKVIALSGGAAKKEQITALKITDAYGLPITFEDPWVNYFFGTFGAGQGFETVANPDATGLNTSSLVGKFMRGNESWSGTYSPLDSPIDFSQGKIIKVLVYNPDPAMIGKRLNVELESAVGGVPANGIAVKRATVTKSGVWEELAVDFSSIPEIKTTTKFGQIVFRFNATAIAPPAMTIYIDDIRFTN